MAIIGVALADKDFKVINGAMRFYIKTLYTPFIIYIGYLYRNRLEKIIPFNMKALLIVFIIQILLLTYSAPIGMDLYSARLHHNISPFIVPFTGIYFTIFAAKLLAPLVKQGSFIDFVGKNTFHIMANHMFVIFLVEVIIFIIDGHSWNSFPDNLYGGKYNIGHYKFLYFALALYFSTYSGVFLNYTGSKIKPVIQKLFSQIKYKIAVRRN